ncbi:hypothetical protein DUNSADRAFT_2016 [Dunaliella salina]|uniref:Uncharacterized protein n=1 Tax=Dunaliella salina TaxID=3046 RepID=A0ABQ7FWY3_DUNSA|nr:hypothetical protein DUNSADRAFT_2016 [Dunaliella salina]|eukprot:KAF5826797.1 hypothetical protein DUNSADRAFT_2016 [Dunaliella salina]
MNYSAISERSRFPARTARADAVLVEAQVVGAFCSGLACHPPKTITGGDLPSSGDAPSEWVKDWCTHRTEHARHAFLLGIGKASLVPGGDAPPSSCWWYLLGLENYVCPARWEKPQVLGAYHALLDWWKPGHAALWKWTRTL